MCRGSWWSHRSNIRILGDNALGSQLDLGNGGCRGMAQGASLGLEATVKRAALSAFAPGDDLVPHLEGRILGIGFSDAASL
jgi:hypothetical protein